MEWSDYAEMSRKERTQLYRRAKQGSIIARRQFYTLSAELKKEANKRLYRLEKANLDYGKNYNFISYFLQTQHDSNRVPTAKKLNYDLGEMFTLNEVILKFLNNKSSLVKNARSSELHRIKTLQEHKILPESFDRKKDVNFLKFLGNEEVSGTIDEYGTSDVIVEMIFGAYQKNGAEIFPILKRALNEFLANRKTFDEAMEEAGINIEDYEYMRSRNNNL